MKKIILNKETIRRLDATDLKLAKGGMPPTCVTNRTAPTIYTCRGTFFECGTVVDCVTQKGCPGGATKAGCTA